MVASKGSYGDKRSAMAVSQIGKGGVTGTPSGGQGTVVLATQ